MVLIWDGCRMGLQQLKLPGRNSPDRNHIIVHSPAFYLRLSALANIFYSRRVDETKNGLTWGGFRIYFSLRATHHSGVPNDSFEENPPYGPLNITRVSLRQSSLIFNFPGKKIPALHRQQAGFRSSWTPSQRSTLRSSTSQHALNLSPS